MNRITAKVLQRLRKWHARYVDPAAHRRAALPIACRGQAASDQIRARLEAKEPCLIGRLGATEADAIICYLNVTRPGSFAKKAGEYIRGERDRFWWEEGVVERLGELSGFFPTTREGAERFSRLNLEDMRQIDILGAWQAQESFLQKYLASAVRVPHSRLPPFQHAEPWSQVLAGRKVLVVHPFEESIRRQYARRKFLFKDPRVLPEFELKTLRSVQSIAGAKVSFRDWFEALDSMKARIDATDYDVAIIGAGAYGLPLGAHVKRSGKKAVHLGGITQMLFGIRGKRWDDRPEFASLYNEHWVRPLPEEAPENFTKVEGGCYW
jgi:hypothetical protein